MFGKIGLFVSLMTTVCFATDLSLEEKVGQVLMAHFHGDVVNDDARLLIQEGKVGSIIYYTWANGLQDPEQVRALSRGLQDLTSSVPLLIAADQEGGVVARLQRGFTEFPGNRALGETLDPTLAREAALITGRELRAVGINMNLAPVVDVNSNPKNPVIGIRSFGEDPYVVTVFGRQALQGYAEAHVIATLKHFPGHGDVAVDSHEGLPIVRKSLEELEACEFIPFRGLSQWADAIMTAHILVPALDPDHCATLSQKTLGFLREEMGFRGLIVADSLVMGGVLKKCHTVDEAAIQALQAGCDLLILGGKLLVGGHKEELTPRDVLRIHGAIVEAVRSGRIPEARLDEAVERVLALKKRFVGGVEAGELFAKIDAPESRAVAATIASRACKVAVQPSNRIAPLQEKHVVVIAPQLVQGKIEETQLLQLGKTTSALYYQGLSPSMAEIAMAKELAQSGDVVLVCSCNAWKYPAAIEMIGALRGTGKPLILAALRDPVDVALFPAVDCAVQSFSPTAVSIQAVADLLHRLY